MTIDKHSRQKWSNMPRKGKQPGRHRPKSNLSAKFSKMAGERTWYLTIIKDGSISTVVHTMLSAGEVRLCEDVLKSVGVRVAYEG